MQPIQRLKDIVTGKASDRLSACWFLVAMGTYLSGMAIAAALYDGGFSFSDVYVSYLGAPEHNPAGWWIYNACELVAGYMLVFAFVYTYRKIRGTMKILAFIGCLFAMIGAAGFGTIGIYYQGADPDGHRITTILAFGGLGIAALLLLPVFVRMVAKRVPGARWWLLVLAYGQLLAGIGIAVGYDAALNDKESEWIYTIVALAWIGCAFAFAALARPAVPPATSMKTGRA